MMFVWQRVLHTQTSQTTPPSSQATPTASFPMLKNHPDVQPLQFKESVDATTWGLNTPLSLKQQQEMTHRVLSLKKDQQKFSTVFTKRSWDIERFNDSHFPVHIEALKNPLPFSSRNEKYLLFMDMPIKMPGKDWQIPKELEQFQEPICKSMQFERLVNPDVDNYYVYLTIDQRPVLPGQSQRRTGWHADSFITRDTRIEVRRDPACKKAILTDSVYLASDGIPTEFCAGPFPFDNLDPNNTEGVLRHFDGLASSLPVFRYPSYSLLRLSPYVVHRVGFNTTEKTIARTFFKMTFSLQILNRDGNAYNPLFDYNWPMVPRSDDKRNHSSVIGDHKDLERFHVVSAADLEKGFAMGGFAWVGKQVDHVYKHAPITAIPAKEGELLKTAREGFTTTVNTAKTGDWKVTAPSGDQYFLSAQQLEALYEYRATKRQFVPKHFAVQALCIAQPIQLMAPWGTIQFLRPGDYLIRGRYSGIYGILKQDFLENYASPFCI